MGRRNSVRRNPGLVTLLESEIQIPLSRQAATAIRNGNFFTYKPGATTNQSIGLYGSVGGVQDPLMDQAIATSAGDFAIFADDSLVTPARIGAPSVPWRPAGISNGTILAGQNLNTVTGLPGGNVTVLAPLPAIYTIDQVTNFVYSGATGMFAPVAGTAAGFYIYHSTLSTTGAGFLIDMTASTALAPGGMSIFMADSVFGSGSFYKWNANVTIASSVELWEFSSLCPNCLSGPLAQIVLEQDAFSMSNCLNQSGITGGVPTPNPIVVPNVAGNNSYWGNDDSPSVYATKGKANSINNGSVNIVLSKAMPASAAFGLTFQLVAVRYDVDDGSAVLFTIPAVASRAGAAAPVVVAGSPTSSSRGSGSSISAPTITNTGNQLVAQGAGVAGQNYKWTGTCLAAQALESQ